MYGETGKRVSTTKIGKLLAAWGFVDKAFTARDLQRNKGPKSVGDETYGNDSYLYIYTGCVKRRRDLERRLGREGLRFNRDYSPGHGTVEIGVSYFRGVHWNE
jgi:hypothetical protein